MTGMTCDTWWRNDCCDTWWGMSCDTWLRNELFWFMTVVHCSSSTSSLTCHKHVWFYDAFPGCICPANPSWTTPVCASLHTTGPHLPHSLLLWCFPWLYMSCQPILDHTCLRLSAHYWTTPASQNTLRKWVVFFNVPQLLYFSTDLLQILCVCKLCNRLSHTIEKSVLLWKQTSRHLWKQVHAKLSSQKTASVWIYFVTF